MSVRETETPRGRWMATGTGLARFETIWGKACSVTLERRPPWCDRGTVYAKVFFHSEEALRLDGFDEADGWPRYYFDELRAKLEIEAWLWKRDQWLEPPGDETEAEP